MSRENAIKFFKMLENEPELARKLVEGEKSAGTFVERLIAEAKQRGLEFTPEQVRQVLRARLRAGTAARASAAGQGELSEADLDKVSGGATAVGDELLANLFTLVLNDLGGAFKHWP
jgi:nitrogen fixation uncharacterized protein